MTMFRQPMGWAEIMASPDALALLEERDRALEDYLTKEEVAPYSYAGAVAAATSPAWYVKSGGLVTAVYIAAGTAGSGSSTFKIKVNGTQVGSTLTLAASDTFEVYTLAGVTITAGSLLTVEVATVGSGLADLSVFVVMRG